MKNIKKFIRGGLISCLVIVSFLAIVLTVLFAFDYFLGNIGSVIGILFLIFLIGGYSYIDIN